MNSMSSISRGTALWLILLLGQSSAAEVLHDGESIDSPTTWFAADGAHIVVGTITINSTLSIEDGSTVRFDLGARFNVKGSLQADGSSSGILFTRRDANESWQGIRFFAGSGGSLQGCTLEHAAYTQGTAIQVDHATVSIVNCTIRSSLDGILHKGGAFTTISGCTLEGNVRGLHATNTVGIYLTAANTFSSNETGIWLEDCANPTIANQTITGSNGSEGALFLEGCGEFTLGAGNVITGNSWGLSMDANSYVSASSVIHVPVSGNTNDGIQIATNAQASQDVRWRDLGADYVATASPGVLPGATLTIDAGCTIRFGFGERFRVDGAVIAHGGTEGIVFTRDAIMWQGIHFRNGSSGTFENCTVEYVSNTYPGVIVDIADVSITDSVVRFNDVGIRANTGSLVSLNGNHFDQNGLALSIEQVDSPELTQHNTFTDNPTGVRFLECSNAAVANQVITGSFGDLGALHFEGCGDFHIGPANVITGNSWGLTMDLESTPDPASTGNIHMLGNDHPDGIGIVASAVTGSSLLRNVGVAYHAQTALSVYPGGHLTIEAGANMLFEPYGSLAVHGSLTVGSDVTATRFEAATDGLSWIGLRFYAGSVSTLKRCHITEATDVVGAGVFARDGAIVELEDCLVWQNRIGLHIRDSSVSLKRCAVALNEDYGIFMSGTSSADFGSDLSEWNLVNNNGLPGVPETELVNGELEIQAPFVYWGSTDRDEIEAKILHQPDDSVLGRVAFSPWTDDSYTETFGSAFTDVTPSALQSFGVARGAAWGDFDADGDHDLYVSCEGTNHLFENQGGVFLDVTPAALADPGQSFDAQWVDFDNDGDLDLAVANRNAESRVYSNDGAGEWNTYFVFGSAHHSMAWADLDRDGDLDVILGAEDGGAKIYYRNPTGFVPAGGSYSPLQAYGIATGDFNDDGWTDVAVSGAEDGIPRTYVWRNSNGDLQNPYTLVLPGPQLYSSPSFADADLDGDLDLFVAGWNGEGTLACAVGDDFNALCSAALRTTTATAMCGSWGDFDNDGFQDLFLTVADAPNRLYQNRGSTEFVEVADEILADAAGSDTAGAAWADYDNDGDLDLFVVGGGGDNRLLRNDGGGNHWIQVDLVGIESNRFGVGAKIVVHSAGSTLVQEVSTGSGWLGGNALTASFGLGTSSTVDAIEVRWPTGQVGNYGPFPADQRLTLSEQVATAVRPSGPTRVSFGPSQPNPTSSATRISLTLPRSEQVEFQVHDVRGRLIRTVQAAPLPAGHHVLVWNGEDARGRSVASGVYYLRMRAGKFEQTQRVIVLR